MKLVIVESPNKCETIQGYLGSDYKVLASKGQIRDLATSGKGGYGVDVEHGFLAHYTMSKKQRFVVEELKAAAKQADEVILATDPDREGEAIAWSLAVVLDLDPLTVKRLRFHEITRDSITEAIEHPEKIDMNLVDSQEARRIIDRIIGFKLTQILNKKIKSKSAGRVQSPTLKLIADHEEERRKFVPEDYWNLSVEFTNNGKERKANFVSFDNIKDIKDEKTNKEILSKIGSSLKVIDIKKSVKVTESKPPLTTSSMMQEAYTTYGFETNKTRKIAQQLFEGIRIDGQTVGLITYIRTDMPVLSDTYVNKTLPFIEKAYGSEYVGKQKKVKAAIGAQGAHEAIRQTSNKRFPSTIKKQLTNDQYKLYKLIYERTLASLMPPKKEEVTVVTFESNGVIFKAEESSVLFDGFSRASFEKKEQVKPLKLEIGAEVVIDKVNNEKKSTEPPALYSEAKIVKLMEEKGIGRPSTYATTIETLKERNYITSNKGQISITDQGILTSIVLNKYFSDFVSVKYTADMEKDLDLIQEEKASKVEILEQFYEHFTDVVEKGDKKMYKEAGKPIEGRVCPKCGSPLLLKQSKYGEFIGCSNYPHCDYIEKKEEEVRYVGKNCPKCGRPLVYRVNKSSKRAKEFIACSGYPECDYIENKKPAKELVVIKKCPVCDGNLVVRSRGKHYFLGCTNYPKCTHREPYKK